jgi:hypothetical protein
LGSGLEPYDGNVLRGALAWIPALIALGCAPTYHRASPYRFNDLAAAALEKHAAEECRLRGEPAGPPTEPFRTDGCSIWPDGAFTGETWQACCVEHDVAYWCGGTQAMRAEADEKLKECVGDRYHDWMGALMKPGVRIGGAPYIPAYWRWGYGHKFPAGYSDPPK